MVLEQKFAKGPSWVQSWSVWVRSQVPNVHPNLFNLVEPWERLAKARKGQKHYESALEGENKLHYGKEEPGRGGHRNES